MPLYVFGMGYPDYILPDLLKITNGDMGIGWTTTPRDPTGSFLQVTYAPTQAAFGATLLDQVVNKTPNYAITINAVESTFVLPNGAVISAHEGATFAPWMGSFGAQDIVIYYDVYECSQSNYWV